MTDGHLSDIVRDIVTVQSLDVMNDVQVMTRGIWVIPRVCWIAKGIRIMQRPNRLPPSNMTRQPNAGSTLVHRRQLWPSTIQPWTVLYVGGGVSTKYKLTPIHCLSNVGPASPVLGITHSAPVSTLCCRYQHDALNQSWVNAGLPSVTLAHIQHGAKHDAVTQYWANVGSAS